VLIYITPKLLPKENSESSALEAKSHRNGPRENSVKVVTRFGEKKAPKILEIKSEA